MKENSGGASELKEEPTPVPDSSRRMDTDRWRQNQVLKDFRAGGSERWRAWTFPSRAIQTQGACESLKQKTEMRHPCRQEGIESAGSSSGRGERRPKKKKT